MKIKTIYSYKNAYKARGLTVVIDVLRAFSTACFVINNGANKIIPIANINLAYKLKKENPKYYLMGERNGIVPHGFDFGNSPAEIINTNFRNKTVIHTTTTGTKSIINAKNADKIITGSFVNATAVINYIKKSKPKIVSLVCSDGSDHENEDAIFAKYIKNSLKNKSLDIKKIISHLERHPCSQGFLKKGLSKFTKKDFYLCLDLDRFDFILKVKKDKNDIIYLKK